jgi:DNA recombination protein RmuC
MRQTVDEKLQGTLDARLTQSFKHVSERLEQLYKGLGEVQSLASGVGDLKRVFTNVKTRGMWGEVQLGAILEQIMPPAQYERNVATTGTLERVEFAIKLPGHQSSDSPIWLPIDAKFPVEDYQRLVDAAEKGDAEGADRASKQLEVRLKGCAKDISQKYIAPPATTDFGILFLPTEGLYAEAMRRPGLAESIQREYRVTLTGPSTLAALLTSLQMGFRTLAIQERSSAAWETLGGVKLGFEKYAELLGRVRKKLTEAQGVIDTAEGRTRLIQKSLRDVETTGVTLGVNGHVPPALLESPEEMIGQ